MSTPAEAYRLTGISPKAYEHPADRAATAALKSIPMLDMVVRKLIEYGFHLRVGVIDGVCARDAAKRQGGKNGTGSELHQNLRGIDRG